MIRQFNDLKNANCRSEVGLIALQWQSCLIDLSGDNSFDFNRAINHNFSHNRDDNAETLAVFKFRGYGPNEYAGQLQSIRRHWEQETRNPQPYFSTAFYFCVLLKLVYLKSLLDYNRGGFRTATKIFFANSNLNLDTSRAVESNYGP